ncbi:MAG TPA: methyltransferase domain-containing protein [Pseudonocardiaceae bacterium]
MTTPLDVTGWTDRAAALRDELVAAGKVTSAEWLAALLAVPRHVFVPSFYVYRDGDMVRVDRTGPRNGAEWLDTVYSNTALVTKFVPGEDGTHPVFLSSSSTPGLMTRMLESLHLRDGDRVLEIGTGTGYNSGLLCHRLGASNVFSIDVEPDLVDLARIRLAELGYHPTLAVGDGYAGLPRHAPFDAIIATCSVPVIPWSWVEQTRVGGVILSDIRVGVNAGNLVRLTRTGPDRAEGRFDAGQAAFMELRHTPGFAGRVPYVGLSEDNPATETTTMLDPRTPWANPVVWFLAAMRVGPHYRLGYTGGDPHHGPNAVSLSTPDGSRTEITLATDADGSHTVRDTGPERLWQHVEHAHQLWNAAGQPDWSRLGMTVTAAGTQIVYSDDPANILATLGDQR